MQDIGNWIKKFNEPLIIAGPCSAESEGQMMTIAEHLDKEYVKVFRAGIWKPRTRPNSFEGVGAIGLKWLKKVKDEFGMLIATEVANANHAKLALDNDVDIIWIGARSTVSPFIIQEIAEALKDTDKIVLVKNPVNPDLELWIGAIERLASQNIKNLGAIHRGFSIYKKTRYRNIPQWDIPLDLKSIMPNIPIICDPSHISGNRDLLFDISQEAFNFRFNGLMIETHYDPDNAWSDAKQQITPKRLIEILKSLEIRQNDHDNNNYKSILNELREEIDELDSSILEIISQRMKVVAEIGNLKKSHNVSVFQSERWNSMKENAISNASSYNLNPEFTTKILHLMHEESVDIQNNIINK